MGNVSLFCFFLLLSFVGKLDIVFFPKLGDSPFLASSGLLAIFPLHTFVFDVFLACFVERKKDMV